MVLFTEMNLPHLGRFYVAKKGVVYINASGTLRLGLESLSLPYTHMKVQEDIKQKFKVHMITRYNVKKVLDFLPQLKKVLACLSSLPAATEPREWPEADLDDRLFDFQRKGVLWLLSRKGGYLADEMGLGKTIQALQFLNNTPFSKAMIVAPASVVMNWADEAKTWAPKWNSCLLGSRSNIEKLSKNNTYEGIPKILYQITWAQLAHCGHLLLDWGIECLIFDEAHRAKSVLARRTSLAYELSLRARSVLLLSGTPITGYPIDLYPQISMITSSFGSFDDFAKRYSPPSEKVTPYGTTIVFNKARNLPELRQRVSDYMISRKKEEVLQDLPSKRYRIIRLPVKSTLKTEWDYIKEKIQEGEPVTSKELIDHRQNVGAAKAKIIMDWIEDNCNLQNPLIVFFVHKRTCSVLEYHLDKLGLSYRKIVGSTSKTARQKNIEDFQAGNVAVMLCSEAGKEGITLTRAAQMVQLERFWVPSDEDQAEARCHRIGQERPVIISHAHAPETIDDFLVSKLARKRKIVQELFGESLIAEDLLDILFNKVSF